VILGGHGLINWADDEKACYELTLSLIERAARYMQSMTRAIKHSVARSMDHWIKLGATLCLAKYFRGCADR
jgi:rhamnose utilization protein RhaD (predicted bifunctional aldolase and dehydrogenase)